MKKITIYVPTRDENGIDLDPDEVEVMVKEAAKALSKENGGATEQEGVGYWINQRGELVRERVRMIFSYTHTPWRSLRRAKRLARGFREFARQEAIAIEYGERMLLVS